MSNFLFTIDTLQLSKRLHKAGLETKVAEEIAEVIKDTQSQSLENVATKQDIRDVKQDLKEVRHDLQSVRHDLQTLEQKFDQKFEMIDQRFESLEQKFDQRFLAIDQRFETSDQKNDQRFQTSDQKNDHRFQTFDQKFETLEYKLTLKMFVATLAAVSIVTWLDKLLG